MTTGKTKTDQQVLREVLAFLKAWPPHPMTAAMMRTVETQLRTDEIAAETARVWVGEPALCEAPAAHLVKVRTTSHGNLQLQIDNVESFDDKVARGDLLRHLGSGHYIELRPVTSRKQAKLD